MVVPVPGARVGYPSPYFSPRPNPYYSPASTWPTGYDGSSYAMQLAQKQAAAESQAESLFRQATAGAERLAAGDRARQEGDVRLAASIYVRLAKSKPPTDASREARDRMIGLAADAREELKKIDASLECSDNSSCDSAHSPQGPVEPEVIREAFRKYDELAAKFSSVLAAKREVAAHVARQRRNPVYAAVLNEPKAKELWELGQQHEKDSELCCAYWVYQDAARLAPAPSALRAQARFEALKGNPEVVRSAETCREVRWCLNAYQRAGWLGDVNSEKAKQLYAEILRRAPADSGVYRAAQIAYAACRPGIPADRDR